jgi:SAM-dependent methyltransferase
VSTPSAQVFDEWYEAIAASPVWDEFVGEALHLPDGVQSTGYLSGPGLLEVVQRLALRRGEMLVELGCGRAGYGLAAIRESGAHLIGVYFAPAALRAAQAAAKRFGVADRAEFRAADLAVTGLSADVADALLCVDAFHFGSSPAAAALECRRVLRPGGRLVITTWAPADQDAARMLPERIARLNVQRDLAAAGFIGVEVEVRPQWSRIEHDFWAAASRVDAGDDPAMITLRDEAREFLPLACALQRLLVFARAPC